MFGIRLKFVFSNLLLVLIIFCCSEKDVNRELNLNGTFEATTTIYQEPEGYTAEGPSDYKDFPEREHRSFSFHESGEFVPEDHHPNAITFNDSVAIFKYINGDTKKFSYQRNGNSIFLTALDTGRWFFVNSCPIIESIIIPKRVFFDTLYSKEFEYDTVRLLSFEEIHAEIKNDKIIFPGVEYITWGSTRDYLWKEGYRVNGSLIENPWEHFNEDDTLVIQSHIKIFK